MKTRDATVKAVLAMMVAGAVVPASCVLENAGHDKHADASALIRMGMLRAGKTPLPPSPSPVVPLDSLADGLAAYLSFDRHLLSVSPDGVVSEASFSRGTAAYMPDMTRVPPGEPRFFPGRFGGAIFMESAWRHVRAGNQFPQDIANAAGVFPAVGSARLSEAPGLVGAVSLRIEATETGDGFATPATETVPAKRQTGSMFVKGSPGARLELEARMEGVATPLGTATALLGDDWQRVEVDYALPDEKDTGPWPGKGRTPPIRLMATLDEPGWFQADALMLESHLGYSGRRGASSWTTGSRTRDGERLQLPPPPNATAGTAAFWASRRGDVQWRVLFCIDNGQGWSPDLRLDLRDNRRVQLVMGRDKKLVATADLPEALDVGDWHHFVVAWDAAGGKVYVDGEPVAGGACDQPPMTSLVNIGGVAGDSSPAVRADLLIDEFALWNRTLKDEEVAALFRRETPLGAGMETALLVDDREPVGVFARDQRERLWPLGIVNNGASPVGGLVATYGIPGVFESQRELRDIPPGHTLDVFLPWSPALVETGRYEAVIAIRGDHADRDIRRSIEVVKARAPEGNAHVIPWGDSSDDLRDLGFTAGAVAGLSPQAVETVTRHGLHAVLRKNLSGSSEDESDRFMDATGARRGFDQRASGPLADVDRQIGDFAERLSLLPDIRHVIVNCEHQWSRDNDFRPKTVAQVKARFGLDLDSWRVPENRYGQAVHPGGRLAQSLRDHPAVPQTGVVALDDPFYAYHRWWHGGEVGNEVFLNDRIGVGARERAPTAQFIGEPVLRRPSLRAFREMDLVQEWFYYDDPSRAIWVQEATAAAARGSRAKVGGMPQFLLKPGMAAPYGGMPTPEMFREAVWHCLARPMRGLTYWNHWSAIRRRGDAAKTQEEIDAILGETPDWKAAATQVSVQGENSSVFLFIPELREEIRRLHQDEVAPLGALIPRWENAPRRIAVYRSFAGELFNNVRWGAVTPLESMVFSLQVPFDILYDEDFEDDGHVLDGYQLVAVSAAPAITEPAFAQLAAFAARGGLVVVDDRFNANIPEALRVDAATHQAGLARLAERERELLSLYRDPVHPNYVEGMEQAARQMAGELTESGTGSREIAGKLRLELSTSTRAVFPNLLSAEGVNYLVAVNMLRRAGRHYGHFGKVREDGVAQTAEFSADPALGMVAYDLLNSTRVALEQRDGRHRFTLDLPPGGGRVLVFLPEPVGRMEVADVDKSQLNRGRWLRLSARLSGGSGQPLPGVIPVRIEMTGPEGRPLDQSRHDAFVNGEWSMELPIAFNQPAGAYRLVLTELASGTQAEQTWSIE